MEKERGLRRKRSEKEGKDVKNVLMLLTNPFRPDPRVYKEAKSLIKGGYKVTIFAWDRDGEFPETEVLDGIKIRRFDIPSSYGKISMIKGLMRFWRAAVKEARKEDFDIVHCHDFDTLPVGLKIGRKMKKRVVYDAHENYASMIEFDVPRPIYLFIRWYEKRLAPRADGVVAVSEPVGKMLPCPYTVVMNARELEDIDTERLNNCKRRLPFDSFVLTYIGVLEPMRFLVEACEVIEGIEGIHLLIGGYGRLEKEIKAHAETSGKITFMGRVPYSDVMPCTAASDVIMCVFDPTNKNNIIGTPNKLFEGMMAGRPVLATKGTHSGDIVERYDCGLVVDYASESFKEAVVYLKEHPEKAEEMGKNGRKAAEEEYNWGVMEQRLLALYKSVLKS